ncbi:MAG: hypothetical protein F4210_04465 [Holophagales bacterium]|nr:hypothetical protein [Holophagales bacterium]
MIGLLVLVVAIASLASFLLLPLLFLIEDDTLRRSVLTFVFSAVALSCLTAQLLLRTPIVWLVDLRPLLTLPLGFRELYGIRFALSSCGLWLIGLGPAAAYLLVARSGGVAGFALSLLSTVAVLWILGRTIAILAIKGDQYVESVVGSLALFVVFLMVFQGIFLVANLLTGETGIDAVATAFRGSTLLEAASFTPPGMLASIFEDPGLTMKNVLRLGCLLLVLGVLALVEWKVLLTASTRRPAGQGHVASRVVPVASVLRGLRSLAPASSLTLIETECTLRFARARWLLIMCIALALSLSTGLMFSETVALALPVSSVLSAVFLNGVRTDLPPATSQVWRESLVLPLEPFQVFRSLSRVPVILGTPVVLVVLAMAFFGAGQVDLLALSTGVCLAASGVVLADAGASLLQLYWPKRRTLENPWDTGFSRVVAMGLVPLPALAVILTALTLSSERTVASRLAAIVALAAFLLSAALGGLSWMWQRRVIQSRGVRHFLETPDGATATGART